MLAVSVKEVNLGQKTLIKGLKFNSTILPFEHNLTTSLKRDRSRGRQSEHERKRETERSCVGKQARESERRLRRGGER